MIKKTQNFVLVWSSSIGYGWGEGELHFPGVSKLDDNVADQIGSFLFPRFPIYDISRFPI